MALNYSERLVITTVILKGGRRDKAEAAVLPAGLCPLASSWSPGPAAPRSAARFPFLPAEGLRPG